jgi:hypothetical protein
LGFSTLTTRLLAILVSLNMDDSSPKDPKPLTKRDWERAAKEFKLSPAETKDIVDQAKKAEFTIEQRQFGVDGNIRDDFERLYESEVVWLNHEDIGGCPLKRIGASEKDKRKCHVKFRDFKHFLVHTHIHLMLQGDARTQKITNESARELVHPTSEKTLKAALGPKERQRMLQDPEHRKRLLARQNG